MRISEKIMGGQLNDKDFTSTGLCPKDIQKQVGVSAKVIGDYFMQPFGSDSDDWLPDEISKKTMDTCDSVYKNIAALDRLVIFDMESPSDFQLLLATRAITDYPEALALLKKIQKKQNNQITKCCEIMSVGGDAFLLEAISFSGTRVGSTSHPTLGGGMIIPVIGGESTINSGIECYLTGYADLKWSPHYIAMGRRVTKRTRQIACAKALEIMQTLGEFGEICETQDSVSYTSERKYKKALHTQPDIIFKTITVGYKKASTGTNYRIDLNDPESTRRKHFCRGHYATYTKDKPLFGKYVGTFYKSPHVRGNAEVGTIVKDYKAQV